jgi:ABC-2 type transport system permease protein
MNDVEVKLRNLEYDLTRTIKKVAFGFGTADAVFAKLDQPAELYAYVTAASLPENFKKAPETIKKVMDELVAESKGKFKYEIIDPDQPGAKEGREVLLKRYGFKPFAVSLFAQETFYLHLLLKVGDRYETPSRRATTSPRPISRRTSSPP